MAITTRNRRASVQAYSGGAAAITMMVPDGDLADVLDRKHMLESYRIEPSALLRRTGDVEVRITATGDANI